MVLPLHFFRRYNLQDHVTLYLNAALLFLILFYTFPLKFLFTALIGLYVGWVPGFPQHAVVSQQDWTPLLAIYGLLFFLVYAVYSLLYIHAYKMRAALDLDEREVWITRYSYRMFACIGLVGLASMLVAFATQSPWLGGLTYGLTGIISGVGKSLYNRKLKSMPPESRSLGVAG